MMRLLRALAWLYFSAVDRSSVSTLLPIGFVAAGAAFYVSIPLYGVVAIPMVALDPFASGASTVAIVSWDERLAVELFVDVIRDDPSWVADGVRNDHANARG